MLQHPNNLDSFRNRMNSVHASFGRGLNTCMHAYMHDLQSVMSLDRHQAAMAAFGYRLQ